MFCKVAGGGKPLFAVREVTLKRLILLGSVMLKYVPLKPSLGVSGKPAQLALKRTYVSLEMARQRGGGSKRLTRTMGAGQLLVNFPVVVGQVFLIPVRANTFPTNFAHFEIVRRFRIKVHFCPWLSVAWNEGASFVVSEFVLVNEKF